LNLSRWLHSIKSRVVGVNMASLKLVDILKAQIWQSLTKGKTNDTCGSSVMGCHVEANEPYKAGPIRGNSSTSYAKLTSFMHNVLHVMETAVCGEGRNPTILNSHNLASSREKITLLTKNPMAGTGCHRERRRESLYSNGVHIAYFQNTFSGILHTLLMLVFIYYGHTLHTARTALSRSRHIFPCMYINYLSH
jgi:hypothetical protein